MVARFWKNNKTAIAKGYGKATAPDYGKMSRKDALAAIASFPAASDATGASRAEALRLLTALKDLDPIELDDNWFRP